MVYWLSRIILFSVMIALLPIAEALSESNPKNIPKGMVFIKGGCYQMGDTFGDGYSDERPEHKVCVDDFYLGKYEVTQKEWLDVMGSNPSQFRNCGENCPVENVSWTDVQKFLRKLNEQTGRKYRLPTEAEWEYAARSGGKKEKWSGTSYKSALPEYAWYSSNSGGFFSKRKTHPVGGKKPNGLGLYDMTGNVWEWLSDWFRKDYYSNSPLNNPQGPDSGKLRVLRGGSWVDGRGLLRTTFRLRGTEGGLDGDTGFRIALGTNN